MESRQQSAFELRQAAAELARQRPHPTHRNNGEEQQYRKTEVDAATQQERNVPSHIANFTKGLPHNPQTGALLRAQNYQDFVLSIDSGDVRDFRNLPLGPERNDQGQPRWESQIARAGNAQNPGPVPVRAWESMGAGRVFDLEGPDAQAVTMPPAPTLNSPALLTEMVEMYSMALLRDVPFALFNEKQEVKDALMRLNRLDEPRAKGLTLQTLFRGMTPGDAQGPYLSQFLLVGNTGIAQRGTVPPHDFADGLIQYGSIRIDQRVRVAEQFKDYMTTWEAWVDAQNGADLRGLESYDSYTEKYRFMSTPRDLATYVHFDALYEAYLNACLIMLSLRVPFDPGLPFQLEDTIDKQQGFAHFGGPHILSLVTEVATRALKAVRYQKFNVHRRARPEALGGLIHRYLNRDLQLNGDDVRDIQAIESLADGLEGGLQQAIAAHNARQNSQSDRSGDANGGAPNSYLLPMAFPEGSPMHPSYGAGHATVAGACVTILKAFFDHGYELPFCYEPSTTGCSLKKVELARPLTVEGELNKVAANIAIGRNWAGVHYYSDYVESIRLGEQIALGILEEQKLTYGENFSMTVPLFDGGSVRI